MRRSRTWLALPMLLLAAVPAAGQTAGLEMRGVVFSVEDGQADRKYLPNVLVTVLEFGAAATTNDQGRFRLRLPAGVLPGQDLTLEEDREDYYILLPVLSKLRVPATPAQMVEILMAPKGSKVLLGANFIEQFIAHTADDSARKPKGPRGRAPDLSSYVNELAKQSGRPAEEILGEITRWATEAKESDDPRTLGLAAFAERKFHLAAENFGRAADAEKRRGAEGFRKSARDRSLEGDSYSIALDFAKALLAYQTALDDLGVYRKGREDLHLAMDHEHDRDVQDLSLKIAHVKINLGIRASGPDSLPLLLEAVRACRELIARTSRRLDPGVWALAQINLADALMRVGERQPGAEGLKNLSDATRACRAALEVYTREASPLGWALAQGDLGNALGSQGERQPGDEGLRSLAEAVKAYHAALEVRTRQALPQEWALTQSNLGKALASLGGRQPGAEGLKSLAEAVEACRAALEVRTRQASPQDWALTQSNLGYALDILGGRLPWVAGLWNLAESVKAYRAALEVFTREALPQDWAMIQGRLGATLAALSMRQPGAEGIYTLAEAIKAYRAALEVYTRTALPQGWALTQNNLGDTLSLLGMRRPGAQGLESLAEAVGAHRAALEVYTRQALPQDWAMTQGRLGNALEILGERQWGDEGLRSLGDAVEAYRAALEVYTRQAQPQGWALTQNYLGLALQLLIVREGFSQGLGRIDRLAKADGLRGDAVALASLRALKVYSLAAGGRDAEAGLALTELVGLIEGQEGDFRPVWNWSIFKFHLTRSNDDAVVSRREGLSQLLDALEPGRGREVLLADLKRLAGAFSGPGSGAGK